jgi:Arc/MetJ-type ribon-helix-helix transcriptional regulator
VNGSSLFENSSHWVKVTRAKPVEVKTRAKKKQVVSRHKLNRLKSAKLLLMMLSLTKEQEAHLQKLVTTGKFDSAQHFVSYALYIADVEDALFTNEAFIKKARTALQEAQDDIVNGRVRTYSKENHHELFDDIQRRGMERLNGQK